MAVGELQTRRPNFPLWFVIDCYLVNPLTNNFDRVLSWRLPSESYRWHDRKSNSITSVKEVN